MSIRLPLLVFTAGVWLSTGQAWAGFIIEAGSSVKTLENVQFNHLPPQSGLTVKGQTNQSDTPVFFSQKSFAEILEAKGGSATIDAADKEFTSLTTKLGTDQVFNGSWFTEFEANPDFVDKDISFLVEVYNYLGMLEASKEFTSAKGSNFFGVTVTGDSKIGAVAIISSLKNSIADVKQVRIGGVSHPITVATPEPGTLTLLAVGGLGMAGGWYRNRRKAAAAA